MRHPEEGKISFERALKDVLTKRTIASPTMVDHILPERDSLAQLMNNHLELQTLDVAVKLGTVELPDDKAEDLTERLETARFELNFGLGILDSARVIASHTRDAVEEIVGRKEARVYGRGQFSSGLLDYRERKGDK